MTRVCLTLAAFALLLTLGTPCVAREIAWQADFSKPDALSHTVTAYDNSLSKKPAADVTVLEQKDGVLRFGLKYDPERRSDRWTLCWGNMIWWPDAGSWEPVDLTKYPVIEMKWRGGRFDAIFYSFETKGGDKRVDYVGVPVTSKLTDPDGSEWNLSTLRIAPDSSAPTFATPVKLLGISISNTSPARADEISEVKYLRLRALNASEAAAEEKVKQSLSKFPKKTWAGFNTWFPYGVYHVGMQRIFETWQGDYAGAFANYSRRHINFIAYNDEVTIGRLGGLKDEAGFQSYLKTQREIDAAAKANGLKLSLGLLADIIAGKNTADGYQQYLPMAKKIVQAFPTDETIVAWGLNDELSAESLIPHAYLMRALRESDPLGRPELVVFNNPGSYKTFADYLSVAFWDHYPILQGEGRRDPWSLRDIIREYRSADPKKPMWAILQAFETRPPAAAGAYMRPSDAEMRLMAHIALAEGVKGIVWFTGWFPEGSLEGLVDRTGTPRGGMFDTISDLGQKLIPIGKLLLPTEKIDVPAFRIDPKSKDHGITGSVLRDKKLGVDYLIVINEDLTQARSTTVTLPKELLGKGRSLYTLTKGLGLPPPPVKPEVNRALRVGPLPPGDARVYVISSPQVYSRVLATLNGAAVHESMRALAPDLTLSRRWKIPVGQVERMVQLSRQSLEPGSLPMPGLDSGFLRNLLEKTMSSDSEFASARKALSDIRTELSECSRFAEVYTKDPKWWNGSSHPQMVPNQAYLEQSNQYWEVGRGYARLYTAFLNGDRKTLSTEVPKLRQDCLKMREALLAAARMKLQARE